MILALLFFSFGIVLNLNNSKLTPNIKITPRILL